MNKSNNNFSLSWFEVICKLTTIHCHRWVCLGGDKKTTFLSFNIRGCIWFKEQHYELTEKKASSNTRIGPEKPTTRSGWAPRRQNNTPWIHVATISSDTPMSPSVFSPEQMKQTRAPASWIIEHRGQTLEFRASNLKYLSESEPLIAFIMMNLLLNNWLPH